MRILIAFTGIVFSLSLVTNAADEIDFNREVRPILSNNCLLCHGPDEDGLEAGLRLDLREVATAELDSGERSIVPGNPDQSELLARVLSDDDDIRMPPADHGAKLTDDEVRILRLWIEQGAKYDTHWSYAKPERPVVPQPTTEFADWSLSPIDHFILARMQEQGLKPSPAADRHALARRVFLDLTGLPPTIEEVDAFVADRDPQAYEKLVDDLLQRPAFGEHWARRWLDLARYADSAGYADDPPRTIWAYRDWVIKAINDNMPFDQFTLEQLAGDLLHEPTESQLIATAFHRNTLTNNEGGTQDEEFRNEAIVDRVNTTMAVWMGTTMACAQCHTHKYDPITQTEYFALFAILNNTQDADKRDESPLIEIYSDAQKRQREDFKQRIEELQALLETSTPELAESQKRWEQKLSAPHDWTTLHPATVIRKSGQSATILKDGSVFIASAAAKDEYTIEIPLQPEGDHRAISTLAALRLEAVPHESLPNQGAGHGGGNFVITGLKAQIVPSLNAIPRAQFVRITSNGKGKYLSLAEVEVFHDDSNIATSGKATQHSTSSAGPASRAIDGNTDGDYQKKSVTHTAKVDDPWWELDLGKSQPIDRIAVWNRTDNGLHTRLKDFTVALLDADREVVWQQNVKTAPNPSVDYSPSNIRDITFHAASADYHQPNFEPASVLKSEDLPKSEQDRPQGWAVGGAVKTPHHLLLIPSDPVTVTEPATLRVTIEQNSTHANHLLGHFRLSVTADDSVIRRSKIPQHLQSVLDQPVAIRSQDDSSQLAAYYRKNVAPALRQQRDDLKASTKKLADLKPTTSVPILREMTDNRRETHLQYRGSYLSKGPLVDVGLPAVFPPPSKDETLDRLALAKWLTSLDNPLTARVVANRYWETIFGRGIVVTSEDFGSQGELPTHPQLLDWLATELMQKHWDTKAVLRLMVTSATYRQSAKVTADLVAADPGNRWLARGPRVRLSAEMVRDQALFASGLLSDKMYGPPVKPPQPSLGLKAAFGGSTDWKASEGEDRYRRGIYTTWRRSNPYPSMATFDAPNREVCTVRRNRTNTPLQSLVTLNDPVYVEAAQSLARLALQQEGSLEAQITLAFRRSVLRPPSTSEIASLVALFEDTKQSFSDDPEAALLLATVPLGDLPDALNATSTAAMTVVCNVLLNLDEMFLKR